MDEFVQNPQGLGVLCLLAFRLVCLAVAYVRFLAFCEVFSRGIKAIISSAAEDDLEAAETDVKLVATKCRINPYDSIRMFYTPAMRRIHRSVCESDPATRIRCASLHHKRRSSPSERVGPTLSEG